MKNKALLKRIAAVLSLFIGSVAVVLLTHLNLTASPDHLFGGVSDYQALGCGFAVGVLLFTGATGIGVAFGIGGVLLSCL